MNLPDGTCFVAPVEKGFLARVATELHSQVFAPTEQPPAGFLYVISKGSARYKGTVFASHRAAHPLHKTPAVSNFPIFIPSLCWQLIVLHSSKEKVHN